MEYFNGLKIQRAKDMIRDGRKNLTEIAGFLSYSSLPYFSKQFKKATGMAPMEYASSVKGITQALKGKILEVSYFYWLRGRRKTGAGSDGERGQDNFELVANFGYIHEGQLTLAKAYVSAGSQSLP
mgnify:CR=1 FL=1